MSKIKFNNFFLKQITILILFFVMINIIALDSEKDKNSSNNSTTKTYTGTVTALQKNKLPSGTDYSYYGTVMHVARLGSLIYPSITDLTGYTVKPGTILIQMKNDFWEDMVLAAGSKVNASKADLVTAIEEYKRYKKLSVTQSLSVEKFQAKRALYYDAITALNEAEAALLEQKAVVRADIDYPTFEGIVEKVMFSSGMSGNPIGLEVTQLNPIGIKIKIPREEAEKIHITSNIKISIPNTNFVQGINKGESILTKDGIIFRTENRLESFYNRVKNNGKIIPDIINCYPVELFYKQDPNSTTLAVPIISLKKDKKGYYVWRAENTKTLQPTKRLNPVFRVKKTYVVPDKYKRNMAGFTFCRALKVPGELVVNDLLLSTLPEKPLKDGDFVRYVESRYKFMPDDTVQVTIDF